MAKFSFLLVLLFAGLLSFGQVKIGLMGGPQSANITEKNSTPGWDSTTGKYYSPKSGFHVGMMAEIPMGKGFYFEPAILYTQKGRNYAKIYETTTSDSFYSYNSNQSVSIQYVDIPLNFAYKLPLSRNKTTNFLISAGPYLSLFYNGKKSVKEHNEFASSTQSSEKVINTSEVLEVGKKDDSYRTFGYGIIGRAGFELGNVTLTGFYSQGLDNLYYSPTGGTFNHKVYGASLGIWLGQMKDAGQLAKTKDKDGDGIPDNKDACPLLPGTAITDGCPDKDGDGTADKKDKCPDIAGLVNNNGCPIKDADKDGVIDAEDKCPSVAGVAKYQGCPIPDTDKDGVNDDEDKCPKLAGLVKYHGCPVPDSDKDGINDENDQCPDEPGKAANGGCPLIKKEMKQTVNYAAENIFFVTNSAILSKVSYGPLNTVVDLLRLNPKLHIVINGYTDAKGTVLTNLVISGERALAVRKYLISKGISHMRIDYNGLGEAHPVATNDTEDGRRKNRRVELILKE